MNTSKQKGISFYINLFSKLKRDSKLGGAPHKPILLLSIIVAIQNNIIKSNNVYILPELVSLFRSLWNSLVSTKHTQNFNLPFYHMRSEPFWRLIPNPGCEKWIESKGSMRSFSNLKIAINYAEIDTELFGLLTLKENRAVFIEFILDNYFQDSRRNYSEKDKTLSIIENEITNEKSENYKRIIINIKNSINDYSFEEEIFIRSGIFKREISKIYNNTCSISGLQVDATTNMSLIDACHIIPFSESYDDTVKNGIALCPNLHRAFDRGLISIDDEYKVILNRNFTENTSSKYNISQFAGKKINLPKSIFQYPSKENLFNHRKKYNFQ